MDECATLKEIISSPRKFKVCKKCHKILSKENGMCDCGHMKFYSNVKTVNKYAEEEVDSLMRIYGYSREDALETEQDV